MITATCAAQVAFWLLAAAGFWKIVKPKGKKK